MNVSVAEFKTGIDRYLKLVEEEDIVLTKESKRFARITPKSEDSRTVIHSLRGILSANATLEKAHEERIAKHERHL